MSVDAIYAYRYFQAINALRGLTPQGFEPIGLPGSNIIAPTPSTGGNLIFSVTWRISAAISGTGTAVAYTTTNVSATAGLETAIAVTADSDDDDFAIITITLPMPIVAAKRALQISSVLAGSSGGFAAPLSLGGFQDVHSGDSDASIKVPLSALFFGGDGTRAMDVCAVLTVL